MMHSKTLTTMMNVVQILASVAPVVLLLLSSSSLSFLLISSVIGGMHGNMVVDATYTGTIWIYTTCPGIQFRTLPVIDSKFASRTLRLTYNTIMFDRMIRHEKIRKIDYTGPSNFDYNTFGRGFTGKMPYRTDIGFFTGNWYNKHGNSTVVSYTETARRNFDDDYNSEPEPPPPPPEYYALLHTEWEDTFVVLLRTSNRTSFKNVTGCSFNYDIFSRFEG